MFDSDNVNSSSNGTLPKRKSAIAQAHEISAELGIFVEVAYKLRTEAVEAETLFLAHLRSGEQAGIHNRSGFATFERVLDKFHICKASRYRDYCAGVDQLGKSEVEQVGMHGTVAILKVPRGAESLTAKGKDAREAVINEMRACIERTGTALTEQNARQLVARHYQSPRAIKTETPLERTARELREVRAELEIVKRERACFAEALGPARVAELLKTIGKKKGAKG